MFAWVPRAETLFAIVSVLGPSASSGATKHYISSEFKYELDLPAGWNIDVSPSGVPVLFNYKRSRGGPQGLFPGDGANMFLIPFAAVQPVTSARTMDEWIAQNYMSYYRGLSVMTFPDSGATARGPRGITEVRGEFERNPQDDDLQQDVSYYFTLDGAMFRLRLLYWKHNVNGTTLRAAAESVLRSIRARSRESGQR